MDLALSFLGAHFLNFHHARTSSIGGPSSVRVPGLDAMVCLSTWGGCWGGDRQFGLCVLALAVAVGCRARLNQRETLGWFAASMMAWDALVAQAQANHDQVHLATSEA